MKYAIIYADPPWRFNNKRTGGSMKSGADFQYPTMTVGEICCLPIQNICADNCTLFMWWVPSQPEAAIAVAKAWGFKIKTMVGFDWVKLTKKGKLHFGMGFYTRMGSEACLIATKGKVKRISASVRAVIQAERLGHSRKPPEVRDRIVKLMGDIPRAELFAREQTPGWAVFGNQVENSIIL